MNVHSNRLIATVTLLLLVLAPVTHASPLETIDQAQTANQSSIDAVGSAPLGQSFIPANKQINFVEFNLQDTSDAATGSHAFVNLRQGSLDGPIIAASEIRYLSDCFSLGKEPGCRGAGGTPVPVRFLFTEDIAVEPGTTYVAELVAIPGMDRFSVATTARDVYPRGHSFQNGEQADRDLWFRIGYKTHNVIGEIPGITGARIICLNETTAEKVLIRNESGSAFDCEAAGLDIRPGDTISLQIAGTAE